MPGASEPYKIRILIWESNYVFRFSNRVDPFLEMHSRGQVLTLIAHLKLTS